MFSKTSLLMGGGILDFKLGSVKPEEVGKICEV